jgi:pimeloyl-ACP methyl ester carboxylesterase
LDGVDLVVDIADGDEPTYLLVHGLASNARLWDGVVGCLQRAGRRSVAVDLRGHGRSSKPGDGYDFPTLVSDLTAVLDAVGSERVVAVGQSWGGNLVVELAARHPERVEAVVCVDGGFIHLRSRFDDWESVWDELAPPVFDGWTRDQLRRRAETRFPGWPAWAVEAQLANFGDKGDGTVEPRLPRELHRRILWELWNQDPTRVVSRVRAPVVVLAVREDGDPTDKADQVERFAASGPVRVIWAEGHHDLHAQRPELVADVLLQVR